MRHHLRTLVCVLLAWGVFLPPVVAGPSSEARNAGEVYERHRSLADAFRYVARDLAVRARDLAASDKPRLVLVIDPTPALVAELKELAETVEAVFDDGPVGLRVGVVGAGAEETPPSGIPAETRSALQALAFIPVPGPKNLLAAVRQGAELLGPPDGAPRAVLLITEDGGDGEDDVERTREALFDAETAFYAIAPESAFERGWLQTFEPRDAGGLTERFHPEVRRRSDETWYFGGDTAFGLVPYRWELDLAQTEFTWVRPPRYPVPSGFGYWPLASLAYTTGGRYFVYDFSQPPRRPKQAERKADRRTLLYDYGRLGRLAPDLRPRARVLKDLSKDGRARTIVRIWEHLADEACPVVGMRGTLELSGGALRSRPTRPVRSTSRPMVWYEDMRDVRKAMGFAQRRLDALTQALKWWSAENARPRTAPDGRDPLAERTEADFLLLGVQLSKVRFHWLAQRAALGRIKPLHVSHRRVRLKPVSLATGVVRRPAADALEDDTLKVAFAELWASLMKVRLRYPRTPWSLVLEKGWINAYELDVRVIEETPDPKRPKQGKGGKEDPQPPKPPPAPPPAGPRPGSATDAPATK